MNSLNTTTWNGATIAMEHLISGDVSNGCNLKFLVTTSQRAVAWAGTVQKYLSGQGNFSQRRLSSPDPLVGRKHESVLGEPSHGHVACAWTKPKVRSNVSRKSKEENGTIVEYRDYEDCNVVSLKDKFHHGY